MTVSNLPNIKVTSSQAGNFDILLKVKSGNLITEKVIPIVFKPEPILYGDTVALTRKAPINYPTPRYLTPFLDWSFGYPMKITQITAPNKGFAGSNLGHGYSKNQYWNFDGTLLKLNNLNIVNGTTYAKLPNLPVSGMTQWSNTNPNLLYVFYNGKISTYNVSTLATAVIYDFTPEYGVGAKMEQSLGQYEGAIDQNDTYCVLMLTKSGVPENVVFNLQTANIENRFTDAQLGSLGYGFDWITVSNSGNKIISSPLTSALISDGKKSYNRSTGAFIANLDVYSHRDCVVDMLGNEVLAGAAGGAPRISIVTNNLTTGAQIAYFSAGLIKKTWATSKILGHTSGQCFSLPGHVFVSMTGAATIYPEIFFFRPKWHS